MNICSNGYRWHWNVCVSQIRKTSSSSRRTHTVVLFVWQLTRVHRVQICADGCPGLSRGRTFPSFFRGVFWTVWGLCAWAWPMAVVHPTCEFLKTIVAMLCVQRQPFHSTPKQPAAPVFQPQLTAWHFIQIWALCNFLFHQKFPCFCGSHSSSQKSEYRFPGLLLFEFSKFLPCSLSLSVEIVSASSVTPLYPTEPSFTLVQHYSSFTTLSSSNYWCDFYRLTFCYIESLIKYWVVSME